MGEPTDFTALVNSMEASQTDSRIALASGTRVALARGTFPQGPYASDYKGTKRNRHMDLLVLGKFKSLSNRRPQNKGDNGGNESLVQSIIPIRKDNGELTRTHASKQLNYKKTYAQ